MLTFIEPIKLAKSTATLDGTLSTAELSRIAPEINGEHSAITYSLKFDYDAHGLCFIEGELSCVLNLTCYRCLTSCEEALHLKFMLSPISNLDKTATLPDIYEPILMNEGNIDLLMLLEEEILLGLPLVPKHILGAPSCIKSEIIVPEGETARAQAASSVTNPFKDLKNLTKS